jgi:hypothetical protein
MRALAILIALVSIGGSARAATDAEPLTAAQIRTMPPDLLARRLLGAVAEIAYPLPPDAAAARSTDDGVQWVRYYTRPRVADRRGLCETDSLNVALAPVGAPGPDTPLRTWRVDTWSAFIIQDVMGARLGGPLPAARRAEQDASCAALDPRGAVLVLAESAAQIETAVRLVGDLIDSAAVARLTVPIACRDDQGTRLARFACVQMIARQETRKLRHVRLVDACGGGGEDIKCWRILLWNTEGPDCLEIDFVFRWARQTLLRIDVRPQPGRVEYD